MPLLHDHIAFHNVTELAAAPATAGLLLQRLPAAVREQLGFKYHSRGRFFAQRASGCELRFVTSGPFFRLTVSADETDAHVLICKGEHAHSQHRLPAGVPVALFIEQPPFFSQVDASLFPSPRRFSPEVWRVLPSPDALLRFHGLETFGHAVRPPTAVELPALTWLAYGSSITFGANAQHPVNSYVSQAARHLGVDALNLGLPGSCMCELAVAEHLAALPGWDFATLELGVNMTDHATPEEFNARLLPFLTRLHQARPQTPLFVTDIFPNRADFALDRAHVSSVRTPLFRLLVREAVASLASPYVQHLPADQILTDRHGLTTDLIHPSDLGHQQMGANLARLLAPRLPAARVT